MVSAGARRKQVGYVQGRGISLRRSCALLKVARSTIGYESTLAERDAPVVAAMRELADQYPRYGYRRIQVFLARRGLTMSADRAYRIWRKAGLQVPRRRPRRRVAGSVAPGVTFTDDGTRSTREQESASSTHNARRPWLLCNRRE